MRALKFRTHINLGGESRTEQAHANDVDINQIMAKAMRGQHSDYIRDHAGSYGDTSPLSYLEANIVVANAKSMFEDLPSKIRNKFENKPEQFLEFVQNPDNLEEMYELKLATKPKTTITPNEPEPKTAEAEPTQTPTPKPKPTPDKE